MEISSAFLVIGLLMTLIGAILIYKSLRASPHDILDNREGIRYIGSIPIIVNGGRKWIVAALLVTAMVIVYLVTKSFYPNVFGGFLNG
jgi:uncharacterized membrane protein